MSKPTAADELLNLLSRMADQLPSFSFTFSVGPHTNGQEQAAAPTETSDHPLVKTGSQLQAYNALIRAGVKPSVAKDLATKYSPHRINTVIDVVQARPTGSVRNPAGLIVQALVRNWYT